jgi:DNA anti-recombination protein RmuC
MYFWFVTLVIAVICLVIWLLVKESPEEIEKEKQRQAAIEQQKAAEEARLRAEESRLRNEQQGYGNQLTALSEQAISLFESLPRHLSSAEKYLDQAEADFADGAFAPFWDSIENAAKELAQFVHVVGEINLESSRYTELVNKYEGTPPKFPISRWTISKLGVGTETAERMKPIVRTAQRNFQFATIYEQRKTNQILLAGFTSLANALAQMTSQITARIDDLAGSVDFMTATLNESMRATHQRIGEIAEIADQHRGELAKMADQHHQQLMKDAAERAAREKKALEMLDNIQRGRRPHW